MGLGRMTSARPAWYPVLGLLGSVRVKSSYLHLEHRSITGGEKGADVLAVALPHRALLRVREARQRPQVDII